MQIITIKDKWYVWLSIRELGLADRRIIGPFDTEAEAKIAADSIRARTDCDRKEIFPTLANPFAGATGGSIQMLNPQPGGDFSFGREVTADVE